MEHIMWSMKKEQEEWGRIVNLNYIFRMVIRITNYYIWTKLFTMLLIIVINEKLDTKTLRDF